MDMNGAELTWVTNHFGHTKDVHYRWYRKEDATVELTKVAKVFCAVDDGECVINWRIDDIAGVEEEQQEEEKVPMVLQPLHSTPRKRFQDQQDESEKENNPPKKQKTWLKLSEEENEAIAEAFKTFIEKRRYPQHHDVLLAMKKFNILHSQGVDKVKSKIKSIIRRAKLETKLI